MSSSNKDQLLTLLQDIDRRGTTEFLRHGLEYPFIMELRHWIDRLKKVDNVHFTYDPVVPGPELDANIHTREEAEDLAEFKGRIDLKLDEIRSKLDRLVYCSFATTN